MMWVRAFLVAGETSAVLIDTGAGGVNLHAAVRECTSLPVRVVNTHAHFDHISGNGGFDLQFAHPRELSSLRKAGFKAHPVNEGSGFDLGGRMLLTVSLPGHTPGSIGLWDGEAGLLFAGDTVARGRPVLLCLEGASLEAYIRSMARILAMEHDEEGGVLSRVFCSHGQAEVGLDTVRDLMELAGQAAAGTVAREPVPPLQSRIAPDHAALCRLGDVSIIVA